MADVRPIVVNSDFVVLGGNMRLRAMIEAGWKESPVEVVNWSEEKQKEFIVKDNVGFGEWNWDLLANEWDAEDLEKWGLDVPGFEEAPEAEDDDYEIPDTIETDIVLGDLFEIGEHRLLCGDSTDSDAVARLMDGQKADMVFTDPPYNIGSENKGIAANVSKAHKELMAADWDKNFDIEAPLNCVFSVLAEDCVVYVCTSHHLAGRIWAWMKEWADHYSYCVWSKPDPMPSLMKRHWTWDTELITYATRGKHTFNAEDGSHSPSTWRINKQQGLERTGHPTQKPVAVPQHAIEKSSRANQIVLDLFGGSGSTLVACEKLGRECRMMELDPKYCDVIVKRWQDFTGKKAILERTGEEFDTLCASISEETVIK